jgi:hypothetical protein
VLVEVVVVAVTVTVDECDVVGTDAPPVPLLHARGKYVPLPSVRQEKKALRVGSNGSCPPGT